MATGPLGMVRSEDSFLRLMWPFGLDFEEGQQDGPAAYGQMVRSARNAQLPSKEPMWVDLDLPGEMLLAHASSHLNAWKADESDAGDP